MRIWHCSTKYFWWSGNGTNICKNINYCHLSQVENTYFVCGATGRASSISGEQWSLLPWPNRTHPVTRKKDLCETSSAASLGESPVDSLNGQISTSLQHSLPLLYRDCCLISLITDNSFLPRQREPGFLAILQLRALTRRKPLLSPVRF